MANVFKRMLLICLTWLIASSQFICAQGIEANVKSRKWHIDKLGIASGFGKGIDKNNLPEGDYEPYFGILHLATSWYQKEGQNINKPRFSLIFEPQFNFVKLRSRTSPSDISIYKEFGLNIGLQHSFSINNQLSVFIFISTGPHYVSVETVRQSKYFIFSDNLGIGLESKISDKISGFLTFRLRHLSNAQIMLPNSGINTFNLIGGICYALY